MNGNPQTEDIRPSWKRKGARNVLWTAAILLLLAVSACNDIEKPERVDFSLREATVLNQGHVQTVDSSLLVCVASILSAREGYAAYVSLIEALQKRTGLSMKLVYPGSYRHVLRLFEVGGADLGFVCSGLYAEVAEHGNLRLLAAPIVRGKNTYYGYVVVAKSSPIHESGELRNRVFAFVDDLSLTGYFYPMSRLGGGMEAGGKALFTGSHDNSISLVNRGLAEGAGVDGLVFEDLARRKPAEVENVRILDKSPPFGMPPVVISSRLPDSVRLVLQRAFLSLHSDSAGAHLLQAMGIDRYALPREDAYATAIRLVRGNRGP